MTGKWRKHAVERLSSEVPKTLEDRLNELFTDGYKLMSVTEREGHTALYSFEFIGQGFETLPNRTYQRGDGKD